MEAKKGSKGKRSKRNFYLNVDVLSVVPCSSNGFTCRQRMQTTLTKHSRSASNQMFLTRKESKEEIDSGRCQYLRYCSKAQNIRRARYLTTLTAISRGDPVICDITSRLMRRAKNPLGCDSRRSAYDCKTQSHRGIYTACEGEFRK